MSVAFWFLRRAAGAGLLFVVGPLFYATYGAQHVVGHHDGQPLKTLGYICLFLGGWLFFRRDVQSPLLEASEKAH